MHFMSCFLLGMIFISLSRYVQAVSIAAKTMKKYLVLLMPVLLIGIHSVAQELTAETKAGFDRLIDARYKADEPGGTVLIARNGKVLYQRGFGLANLEQHIQMQPDMLFGIGSQTKQFTAVCALKMAEQGKLQVTDPISRYIDHCPPAWQDITIENLMTHSSGISDLRTGNAWALAAKIDSAITKPLAYKPGTKTFYANIEFEILGYIVEKVSGESIVANFKNHIIEPLGLKNTYAPSGNQAIPGLIPCYVKRSDGRYNSSDNIPAPNVSGAGGLISNTKDMMIWYEALASGKVLTKQTMTKAWEPYRLADGTSSKFGYGWRAGGDVQGSPIAEHGGLGFGFSTESIYLMNEHVYVGVFLNQRSYADATAQELAAILLGKPYPVETASMTETELLSCAGIYKDDSGAEKLFSFLDGKLYYEPKGAVRSRLAPYSKNRFFLDNTLVECEAVRDSLGKVTAMRFRDRRFSTQPGWTWIKSS